MALRSFPALLLLAGCLLLVGSSSAVTDHLRKPGASLLSADAEPYLPRKRPELALTLGDLVYGGSGCSEGSATLTTAGPLYTLQFSNYTAAVSTGPRRVRKTCNVFIPVQAPPGIQVAVAGVSPYRRPPPPDDLHIRNHCIHTMTSITPYIPVPHSLYTCLQPTVSRPSPLPQFTVAGNVRN
mmetsp:Transcript_31451/g.78794  ORF Transcript_31451/g.78794 Transcript_31451/m.78794 type:complete len:182 (+) Transcript_31451:236-781(+)